MHIHEHAHAHDGREHGYAKDVLAGGRDPKNNLSELSISILFFSTRFPGFAHFTCRVQIFEDVLASAGGRHAGGSSFGVEHSSLLFVDANDRSVLVVVVST